VGILKVSVPRVNCLRNHDVWLFCASSYYGGVTGRGHRNVERGKVRSQAVIRRPVHPALSSFATIATMMPFSVVMMPFPD